MDDAVHGLLCSAGGARAKEAAGEDAVRSTLPRRSRRSSTATGSSTWTTRSAGSRHPGDPPRRLRRRGPARGRRALRARLRRRPVLRDGAHRLRRGDVRGRARRLRPLVGVRRLGPDPRRAHAGPRGAARRPRAALTPPGGGIGHVAWLADDLEAETARLQAAGLHASTPAAPGRCRRPGSTARRSATPSRCCSAASRCSASTRCCARPPRAGTGTIRSAELPRRRHDRRHRPRLRPRGRERRDRRPRRGRARDRARADALRRRQLPQLGRLPRRGGRAGRGRPPRRPVLRQDPARRPRRLRRRAARGAGVARVARRRDPRGGDPGPDPVVAALPGRDVTYRQFVGDPPGPALFDCLRRAVEARGIDVRYGTSA